MCIRDRDRGKDIRDIENNLDSEIVTPKHFRGELAGFVHHPETIKLSYRSEDPELQLVQQPRLLRALVNETRTYDMRRDPYVIELRERNDARAAKHLQEALERRKTYCAEQLRAFTTRAEALNEQLGGDMCEWFVRTCINRSMAELDEGLSPFPDMSEKERRHLASILSHMRRTSSVINARTDITPLSMSDKATVLVSYLLRLQTGNFRSILFVEQRAVVKALAHMLHSIPDVAARYSIGTFMGNSISSRGKATIADLADYREQATDLETFRSGQVNPMIATNVLDEGNDVLTKVSSASTCVRV